MNLYFLPSLIIITRFRAHLVCANCIMQEREVKVVFFLGSFFRQLKGVVWEERFE